MGHNPYYRLMHTVVQKNSKAERIAATNYFFLFPFRKGSASISRDRVFHLARTVSKNITKKKYMGNKKQFKNCRKK